MTKARDLMTADVLTVDDDISIAELARFLIEQEITGAVVLGKEGNLAGVVSMTDITSHVKNRVDITASGGPDFYVRGWQESLERVEMLEFHIEDTDLRVRDILNPSIYTIAADAELSEVAEAMLSGHLHRILVMEDDELVGIISTSDFLKLFAGGEVAHQRISSRETSEEVGHVPVPMA